MSLAACSSTHGRDDGNNADGGDLTPDAASATDAIAPLADAQLSDAIVQADANRIVSCERAYVESAFVPDSLFGVAGGGVIPLLHPDTSFTTGTGTTPLPPRPAPPLYLDAGVDASSAEPGDEDPGGAPIAGNCGSDEYDGYAWDGHRCRRVLHTYCLSAGCSDLYADAASCTNDHESCEPEQCRKTGGVWTEFATSCEKFACGVDDFTCAGEASAQCVCPAGETFGATGCLADPSCEANATQNGCRNSGGRWNSWEDVPYFCGVAGGGTGGGDPSFIRPRPTTGTCDCGPGMTFNIATLRCEDAGCTPDHQALCEWSGGVWNPGYCGDAVCGVPNPADCAVGGCDCGGRSIFDSKAGCVLAPYCRTNMCF